MATKATLPIDGHAMAEFGLAPLHNMYGYEDRSFDLVWFAPLMGPLYGSNLKVDLGSFTKTEGPSTNRRPECLVTFGMRGRGNGKKPHHQLLVYRVVGHARASKVSWPANPWSVPRSC